MRCAPARRTLAMFLVLPSLAVSCGRTKPASPSPADSGVPSGADAGASDAGVDGLTDGSSGPAAAPSFPGAAGWGGLTPGGRGGAILRVTTLAASGPGSLSAAIGTSGPRIIVFEVGGVIDMAGIRLNVLAPFVTIAGQTAPSPGITIVRGGLRILAHDVVVRHIRVRPGEAGRPKTSGWEEDAMGTDRAYNVIIDHCSATWGTDENLSASGDRFTGATPDDWRRSTSHAITFSHNIVAEGLSVSTHSEGEHSKGGLIHDNVTQVVITGNLYFSNMDRHPLFKGGARGFVVNNVVANPGRWAMQYALNAGEWTTHPYQVGQMAIVGNVVNYGPSTPVGVPLLRATGVGSVEAFFDDNLTRTNEGVPAPLMGGTVANILTVDAPAAWPPGLTPRAAAEVAEAVRANVGARPWDRDAIDTRIVEQALSGGGAIISSENEVGGYPTHAETRAAFDPEEWDLETMERKDGTQQLSSR